MKEEVSAVQIAEQITILYANYSGRESENRAQFRKEVLEIIESLLAQARQEERKLEWKRFENGMVDIGGLQARCPQCGKEHGTKMTYFEAFRINALWGRCFKCVSEGGVMPSLTSENSSSPEIT